MSRRHTNFLLLSLRLLVTLAFTTDQKLPTLQNHIRLYQIPGCIETAVKKFNVDTIRTVYACCPVCSTLYAPDCREMGKGYPEECDARRSLCADPCRAALLRLPSKLPFDRSCILISKITWLDFSAVATLNHHFVAATYRGNLTKYSITVHSCELHSTDRFSGV